MSLPFSASPRTGHVFWLFGLSGAGKSTLAAALDRTLREEARRETLLLDGDRLRAGLSRGLGFGDEDRSENLRRGAEVARLGVESGLLVIAAFITPLEAQRRLVESIVERNSISMIFIDAPLELCRRRDVKGLYRGAANGAVPSMTGITSVFEDAQGADLRLMTGVETLPGSAARLAAFARQRLEQAKGAQMTAGVRDAMA
ncbi:MAG: adenylylsulfate kinase [Verrucomicrobia bacterium]|nr:adenylylsulfate kinase [Verrucomicrobiota bacterium]